MTLGAFTEELASNSPAPGGGSVAALCGALAAGLGSMVAALTVGKEKYKDSWEKMEEALKTGERLRGEFIKLMNEDTESFNLFMKALKMPKDTEEQKASRRAAMAEASKTATEAPLRTLEKCCEAAKLSLLTAENGNTNAMSDAGVAALLSTAAAKAAAYNVRINLPGVKDESFASDCRARMAKALAETEEYAAKTAAKVEAFLG